MDSMSDVLRGWLDLARQAAAVQLWWMALWLVSFADWYLLAFHGKGLLGVMASSPQGWLQGLGEGWMLQAVGFGATAAMAWFYVLPMLAYMWWHLLIEVSVRWPWLLGHRWPSAGDGWRTLDEVSEHAALTNNAVLMALCDARRQEIAQRGTLRRCLLGALLVQVGAAVICTADTGPSLGLAATFWLDESSAAGGVFLLVLAVPGAIGLFGLLVDQSGNFDHYIRLRRFSDTDKRG